MKSCVGVAIIFNNYVGASLAKFNPICFPGREIFLKKFFLRILHVVISSSLCIPENSVQRVYTMPKMVNCSREMINPTIPLLCYINYPKIYFP
jgi:hypothetical protein